MLRSFATMKKTGRCWTLIRLILLEQMYCELSSLLAMLWPLLPSIVRTYSCLEYKFASNVNEILNNGIFTKTLLHFSQSSQFNQKRVFKTLEDEEI